MQNYTVRAHWDADAAVWWAESDDVPGLVAEAATHDELVRDLRQIIPELLGLNRPGEDHSSARLRLISEQIEELASA